MKRYLLSMLILISFMLVVSGCISDQTRPHQNPETSVDLIATRVTEVLTESVATPTQSFPAQKAEMMPDDTKIIDLIVVYEKSGNLWLWTENSRVQLTNSGQDHSPKISNDRNWIIFKRDVEIWAVDGNGQNAKKIFSETGKKPLQFGFAPFSNTVYFTTSSLDGKPNFDLNKLNVQSGELFRILKAGLGGEFTFSPDGRMLVLVNPGKIAILQTDAIAPQIVYSFQPIKIGMADYLPHITWMENEIGFKTVIPGIGGKPARFILLMINGGKPAVLAEFHPAGLDIADSYIAPDGSKVLYISQNGSEIGVHVIDISTADKLYLSHKRDRMGIFGWMPDSESFLFWLDDKRTPLISTNGTQTRLSDVTFVEYVYWIDSKTFLFLNGQELRIATIDGKSLLIDQNVEWDFSAASGR